MVSREDGTPLAAIPTVQLTLANVGSPEVFAPPVAAAVTAAGFTLRTRRSTGTGSVIVFVDAFPRTA